MNSKVTSRFAKWAGNGSQALSSAIDAFTASQTEPETRSASRKANGALPRSWGTCFQRTTGIRLGTQCYGGGSKMMSLDDDGLRAGGETSNTLSAGEGVTRRAGGSGSIFGSAYIRWSSAIPPQKVGRMDRLGGDYAPRLASSTWGRSPRLILVSRQLSGEAV